MPENIIFEEKRKRLFVSNFDDPKWEKELSKNHVLHDTLTVKIIPEGIILPLKIRHDVHTPQGTFEGGVCTNNFEFVGGLRRNYNLENANIACCRSYQVPREQIVHKNDTVIFGGVLHHHFGELLTNDSSRLWYFSENPNCPYKYAFVMAPGHEHYFQDFFDLLGLKADQIEIIKKPTQYSRVIVPDESVYILSCASPKWLLPFDRIKENVRKLLPPPPYDKIYLSRTNFLKYNANIRDGINEEYYEDFFRKQGFEVVHPETLPLAQQVNIIMNAREIVCTFGTLSHLALFAQNGIKHTSLLRVPELWPHQFVINAVRQLDWYWVESTINPLTTSHDFGIFLYHPTRFFIQYLKQNGYPERLIPEVTTPLWEHIKEYLKDWVQHFSDPRFFWQIKDKTAFDELKALSKALFNKELYQRDYPRSKIIEERDNLKSRVKMLHADTQKLQSRITDLCTDLQRRQEDLIAAQKQINTLNDENMTLNSRANDLRTELSRLKAQNEEREKLYIHALYQINTLKNSTSWKMTAPLRSMARLIRRLFKHI